MGKALYRTYRSTSFDEVLGQEHVTTTLKNAIKNGHINHAYLFTGPRGVGKTSVARILAHAVNKLDYSENQNHIDIIEIDAASNRRIDEIRELRERVMVAPTSAKYKVYIIDEVHMLTREAFNALLKTLEEPPEHVIFILATTEFHKLPETIVSRCLRFNFKPVVTDIAAAHLRHIAKKEGIQIDDDALTLIASHGEGSFRDSISQLDQIRGTGGAVSLSDVQRLLGIAPKDRIDNLLNNIASGKPDQMLETLAALYDYGVAPDGIAKQLSAIIREKLISGNSLLSRENSVRMLNFLLETQASHRAAAQLELALLEITLEHNHQNHEPTVAATKKEIRIKKPEIINTKEKLEPELIDYQAPKPKPLPHSIISKPSVSDDTDPWPVVLTALKVKNNTLYSIARMANSELISNVLILTFTFAFHHKQISESKNKSLITDIVNSKYPEITNIEIKLASKTSNKDKQAAANTSENDSTISSISNIFGDAEVLES